MAGNSQRKGAIRKTGKKPAAGSGGRVRRGLEGKGPTPKAKDRPHHKAHQQRARQEKAQGNRPKRRDGATDSEWVAGRNSVVEALRAGIPVTGVYVAEGAQRDGRLREAFSLAAEQGVSLLEVTGGELDRMTGGAVHQGLAARIPPYEYAHPDDLLELAAERKEPPFVVALDSVTDPRNLGAVIRSASGFGAHGVLIPERRAAGMTAAAWKTSAGAAARVPVAQTVNLTWPTGRSWSWSARRARDSRGWWPRPATSWCRSPWPGGWNRSTRVSLPGSRCTRSLGPAPDPPPVVRDGRAVDEAPSTARSSRRTGGYG
jgi:23S rRNA (guanosine2251-2'-O)-methyltransferase